MNNLLKTIVLIFSPLSLISCSTAGFELENKTIGAADFQVNVSIYHPTQITDEKNTEKSLLIMPPTGGTNIIDKSYAKRFSKIGYDVYILNSWTADVETTTDLEIHQSFYSKAQKAISLVLSEVKTPFIGLIGTSVGALHASIAASKQDKINAVFVIVGGTPIAEVVASSDQEAMVNLKKDRQKRFNLQTTEDQITAIQKVFNLEPLKTGEAFKKKDLGMSISENDTTVAFKTQTQLKELWHPRKVINLSSNHFWGIVKTWWFHTGEIVDFFEDSFKKHTNINNLLEPQSPNC